MRSCCITVGYCPTAKKELWGAIWEKFHDENHPDYERYARLLAPFQADVPPIVDVLSPELTSIDSESLPCGCSEPGKCSFYSMDFTSRRSSWELSHGIGVSREHFLLTKKLILDFIAANPGSTPLIQVSLGAISVISSKKKPCNCGKK